MFVIFLSRKTRREVVVYNTMKTLLTLCCMVLLLSEGVLSCFDSPTDPCYPYCPPPGGWGDWRSDTPAVNPRSRAKYREDFRSSAPGIPAPLRGPLAYGLGLVQDYMRTQGGWSKKK